MKKVLRSMLSLALVFSVIGILNVASVAAESSKVPDAFNDELVNQKLLELSASPSSDVVLDSDTQTVRIHVAPGDSMTITLDDGSSVTYFTEVVTSNNASAQDASEVSPLAGMKLKAGKTYTWGDFSYAQISVIVDEVNYNWSGTYGEHFKKTADSATYQWIDKTLNATVQFDTVKSKEIVVTPYRTGIRAQGLGTITYSVAGVTSQESYSLIWQIDDLSAGFYFLTSY